MRVVCLGKSKANVPEVTVKGRGAGEVRRAVRGHPQWGIWLYSISAQCVGGVLGAI